MESHQGETQLREIPDLDTLHELLARLNEVEQYRPVNRTEHITVEDVAETLGFNPDYVAQEFEAIMQEHCDARLAGVIRELEEPLYRVERTGHAAHDPLGNPLHKLRSVQILTERNKVRLVLPRRKHEESFNEKAGNLVGRAMLVLMVVLMAILALKTLVTMMIAR